MQTAIIVSLNRIQNENVDYNVKNPKRVSILIPCHNAEVWIEEALQSAIEQTWSECEIIVIDDGSTDRSVNILEGWKDRVTVVCRENRGGNPTRNELLHLAKGDWVQFLDADDYLLPKKVAEQMAVAAANPRADVIYSPQVIEHHCSGSVTKELWNPHNSTGDHDPWAYHLGWNLTQTGGAVFRRKTLIEVGGWNEEQQCCQDNELYFRLLKNGAVFKRSIFAGSVYRRFAGGSVSTDHPERLRKAILKLLEDGESFLESIKGLTPRRLQALNSTRFNLARGLWSQDEAEARRILLIVKKSYPSFQPSGGPQAPMIYRICFYLFGFSGAERIAAIKRGLFIKRTATLYIL